ncbi:hypothetical protein D3C87_838920 [compost metagenome]
MSKLLRRGLVVGAAAAILVILYGEINNEFSRCPEGTMKVRLYDGGIGCVTGTLAIDTFPFGEQK